MIPFGPAAAPRWFDCDLKRFPAYLEHIALHGATTVEFVALPDIGSEETRRVHIAGPDWSEHVAIAHAFGLTINVHWPLLPAYRMETIRSAPDVFAESARRMMAMVDEVSAGQSLASALVIHGDSDSVEGTFAALSVLRSVATEPVTIVLEQRVPRDNHDRRWDRSLTTLADTLKEVPDHEVGICWDIANGWLLDSDLQVPADSTLTRIRHIHLHDSRPDRTVHAPLGGGKVPWQNLLSALVERGWEGSLTLEIRYRYAREAGEPWAVIANSLDQVRHILHRENS